MHFKLVGTHFGGGHVFVGSFSRNHDFVDSDQIRRQVEVDRHVLVKEDCVDRCTVPDELNENNVCPLGNSQRVKAICVRRNAYCFQISHNDRCPNKDFTRFLVSDRPAERVGYLGHRRGGEKAQE